MAVTFSDNILDDFIACCLAFVLLKFIPRDSRQYVDIGLGKGLVLKRALVIT